MIFVMIFMSLLNLGPGLRGHLLRQDAREQDQEPQGRHRLRPADQRRTLRDHPRRRAGIKDQFN